MFLLVLGYVEKLGISKGKEDPVKVEVPDDHVILVSFEWLFMDIGCLNFVELYLGGDQF